MTGRRVYLRLHVLDRQLVDRSGDHVGKIDDLEIEVPEHGSPTVTAIRSGPGVLAHRLGLRRYGRWLQAAQARLERRDAARLPFSKVSDLGATVSLAADADELATHAGERWVKDHVIGHIPGQGVTPEGANPTAGEHEAASSADVAPTTTRTDRATTILLGDLLGSRVIGGDGSDLGRVHDVLAVQDGPVVPGFGALLRVEGLVVGGHLIGSRLGFHRVGVEGPAPLKALFERREREGTRFVPCEQVESWVGDDDERVVRIRCRAADLEAPPVV